LTTTHRLELDVVDDPTVLLRIVGTCHQRGCRILSLHYEWGADAGYVALGVDADNPHTRRLELWLSKLIHVLAVRTPETIDEVDRVAMSVVSMQLNGLKPDVI
jgi:acetolactate synthase regulatory subunit